MPTESSEAEDESIIDLVEEIEEDTIPDDLPSPDPSMPAVPEPPDSARPPAAELDDLGTLDFEEEDQPLSDDLSLKPAAEEYDTSAVKEDLDWLLDAEGDASPVEGGQPADAASHTGLASGDTHAAAPETEALLEALIPPSAETDADSEEDDIELIEIEDAEDDEIVWFDDPALDQAPPGPELASEVEAPLNPLSKADADLFPETSAADVFAANVASGEITGDSPSVDWTLPTAAAAAAASLASSSPASPASAEPPIPESISLSDEQIDAALERVIERRLGSTLESVILRAVESAVAMEIQRLKRLLLEDDSSDPTP
jgi:hypothetical protein